MQLKKTLTATALAVLACPLSALAEDIVYSFEEAELTLQPSVSFALKAKHSSTADVEAKGGVKLFKDFNPKLRFEIDIGVDGQLSSKASKDIQFLFGANGIVRFSHDGITNIDWTELPGNEFEAGDAYIGLGSPLGNLKYGKLSVDPEGSLVDIGAKFYGRTDIWGIDGMEHGAVRFESAQLGPVTFTLTKGAQVLDKDVFDDPEGTDSSITGKLPVYGGTLNYTSGDFAAKYVGAITSKDGEPLAAHTHRIEGTYMQGPLSFGLGYQYAKSNLGWAHKDFLLSDSPLEAKDDLANTLFKTHEAIASATYTLGKFTPKTFVVYGRGAKSIGTDATKILPSYLELGVGVDYALGAQTTAKLSLSNLNFIKSDTLSNAGWKNARTVSFGLSHKF